MGPKEPRRQKLVTVFLELVLVARLFGALGRERFYSIPS